VEVFSWLRINYAQGFIHKIQQGSSNSRKATNLLSPNAREYPNSQNWMVKKEINPTSIRKTNKIKEGKSCSEKPTEFIYIYDEGETQNNRK